MKLTRHSFAPRAKQARAGWPREAIDDTLNRPLLTLCVNGFTHKFHFAIISCRSVSPGVCSSANICSTQHTFCRIFLTVHWRFSCGNRKSGKHDVDARYRSTVPYGLKLRCRIDLVFAKTSPAPCCSRIPWCMLTVPKTARMLSGDQVRPSSGWLTYGDIGRFILEVKRLPEMRRFPRVSDCGSVGALKATGTVDPWCKK